MYVSNITPPPEVKIADDQRWEFVKAHITKGDKAQDKADEHYKAAGIHLNALKTAHTGTWAEWEVLVKEKADISKSRASELMQIADGTKTVKQVRNRAAESMRQTRAKISPQRCGETEAQLKAHAVRIRELLGKQAEMARELGVSPEALTNVAMTAIEEAAGDPEASAVAMKEKFAELDGDEPGEDEPDEGAPFDYVAEVQKLIHAAPVEVRERVFTAILATIKVSDLMRLLPPEKINELATRIEQDRKLRERKRSRVIEGTATHIN
jgi:hypothetical protein